MFKAVFLYFSGPRPPPHTHSDRVKLWISNKQKFYNTISTKNIFTNLLMQMHKNQELVRLPLCS